MINILKLDELDRVVDQAEAFFKRCQLEGEFNHDTFIKEWQQYIRLNLGVIYHRDYKEAMGVLFYKDPNTGVWCAATAFWYVHEKIGLARGHLVRYVERRLKEMGITRFFIGAMGTNKLAGPFLEGRGYKRLEQNYAITL